MSDNLDNLLGDIYSSSSQSQGVKELANLINNLSQLLLKAISQLEGRVTKLERSLGRSPAAPRPPAPARSAPAPTATPPAPKPKVASPFGAPQAPARPTPPPPATTTATPAAASSGPTSAAAAASMLGVTLKPAPKKEAVAVSPASTGSGPAFLTGTVNATPTAGTPDAIAPSTAQPDAVAPASAGIAGPAGGFRGELAEKLERRRQRVQQQLEDDFESPDLQPDISDEEEEDESASSELKLDLEDELRSAFSKLKE